VKIVEIREATPDDAEDACAVVRRSIVELCRTDHQGDAATIAAWLANKSAENMRRWIGQSHVFVAVEQARILGVAAMTGSGEFTLNYVSPEARLRGVSKALVRRLERRAVELGIATISLQSTATALRFYEAAGYRRAGAPIRGFGITLGYPMIKTSRDDTSPPRGEEIAQ
jgi:GNAT superfamily N-acetyltransferase